VVRLVVASSLAFVAGVGIGLLLDGKEQNAVPDAETRTAAEAAGPRGPAGVPAERWFLPASRAAPEEVVVSWNASERSRATPYESGFSIWRRLPAPGEGWRPVHSERFPNLGALNIQLGDVTRDRHDDILIEAAEGSAGCGVRHVLATVGGRVREIYRSPETCEASFFIAAGALYVVERIGPCPYPGAQSAHCRGGERRTVRRWNGKKLVAVRSSVACDLPRLDPARGCRARR
jgi:hypothetical protein